MTTPQGEGVSVAVQLTAAIGDLSTEVTQLRAAVERDLNQDIYPLIIEMIAVPASTTIDQPNMMGPRTGRYWDIKTVVAQNFAAGTINGYMNSASGVQRFGFTATGYQTWGKGEFLVQPGQRLVVVGSASLTATTANISIYGVSVAAERIGEYLL